MTETKPKDEKAADKAEDKATKATAKDKAAADRQATRDDKYGWKPNDEEIPDHDPGATVSPYQTNRLDLGIEDLETYEPEEDQAIVSDAEREFQDARA